MTLTILELLYVFLIAFVSVIGVLLSIVLIKVIKILNVANEITGYYTKAKMMLSSYAAVPKSVKDNIKSKVTGSNKK